MSSHFIQQRSQVSLYQHSPRMRLTDSRARRLRFERLEARAMLSVSGDFNGDGIDDLAIGAPLEKVGGIVEAGAVTVIYGTRKGLKATGHQFWHLNVPGVNGSAEAGDFFGGALAVGDFNGDGFDDLAIGSQHKTVSGKGAAGAVNILYGSKNGLRAGSVDQLWTQDSPGINDKAENSDFFGHTLAAGDFNRDGFDDLAIGVPNESVGTLAAAGAVNVIYGSKNRLTAANDQFWTQDSPGINDKAESGDGFGFSLAVGDFNGDGRDDLAIGAPEEGVNGVAFAGMVNVIYGSSSRLTGVGDQHWHRASAGVPQDPISSDEFGIALAAGDFNGDKRADLAIGIIGNSNSNIAGAVQVINGSASKLTSAGNVLLTATALGFTSIPGAWFATILAAGDFDRDGFDDLAIGASRETVSGQSMAGAVYVAYGSRVLGLIATGAQRWHQDSTPNMPDVAQSGDIFGTGLVVGDFNGDGYADLAIGVPFEKFGALTGVGAVQVLYGFFVGLVDVGNQFWHQGLLSSTDGNETDDAFGGTLG